MIVLCGYVKIVCVVDKFSLEGEIERLRERFILGVFVERGCLD